MCPHILGPSLLQISINLKLLNKQIMLHIPKITAQNRQLFIDYYSAEINYLNIHMKHCEDSEQKTRVQLMLSALNDTYTNVLNKNEHPTG